MINDATRLVGWWIWSVSVVLALLSAVGACYAVARRRSLPDRQRSSGA